MDGVDRVYKEIGKPGNAYEPDTARIKVMGFPSVINWTHQREEIQEFEVVIMVGNAYSTSSDKQALAHLRMRSFINLIEGEDNASLGGIVDDVTWSNKDSGVGELKLDVKGEWAGAVGTIATNRMVVR